jgi:hypothetical protein
MAPLLGPKLKEAKWKVESGMAKQRANPATGKATREMSRKTESEGHLSAASFVTSSCAFARPKHFIPADHCRPIGKPLKNIGLGSSKKWIWRKSQADAIQLECRILHIRCMPQDCK